MLFYTSIVSSHQGAPDPHRHVYEHQLMVGGFKCHWHTPPVAEFTGQLFLSFSHHQSLLPRSRILGGLPPGDTLSFLPHLEFCKELFDLQGRTRNFQIQIELSGRIFWRSFYIRTPTIILVWTSSSFQKPK